MSKDKRIECGFDCHPGNELLSFPRSDKKKKQKTVLSSAITNQLSLLHMCTLSKYTQIKDKQINKLTDKTYQAFSVSQRFSRPTII